MRAYKTEHITNWYYGNYCVRCGRIDIDGNQGRDCYDRLRSLNNALPEELTHKEYVQYVKNKAGFCRPTPRTFHECPICKALGVPTHGK